MAEHIACLVTLERLQPANAVCHGHPRGEPASAAQPAWRTGALLPPLLPLLRAPCYFPFPRGPATIAPPLSIDLHRNNMASNKAHHATGWAAGLIAAALVAHAGTAGPQGLRAGLALFGAIAGGTAPDWLEVAWWSRSRRLWITHRTLTHWGIGWAAACAWAYHSLAAHPVAALGFGFACGGLMHLLADWPNPRGVPWIYGRHSLKLWNSGRCDLIVIAAAWLAAAAVADHVWFHGIHSRWLVDVVRAGRPIS